jgi:membrane protein DedA with SNARE-associated domain
MPTRLLLLPAFLISGREINHLLGRWGYTLVFAAILLQSSGVPVPGTTALVAAAIYAAATHHLAIAGVIAAAAGAAILGGTVSFAVGRSGGWMLLSRYGDRVRLTEPRLELGRRFFAAHGGKVVFFGRFITGLRTWGGLIAGANRMTWSRFLPLNVAGGVAWAVSNGIGYFYFGHLLTSAGIGVDIALGLVGLGWLALSIAYLRRRLHRAAETLSADHHGPRSNT